MWRFKCLSVYFWHKNIKNITWPRMNSLSWVGLLPGSGLRMSPGLFLSHFTLFWSNNIWTSGFKAWCFAAFSRCLARGLWAADVAPSAGDILFLKPKGMNWVLIQFEQEAVRFVCCVCCCKGHCPDMNALFPECTVFPSSQAGRKDVPDALMAVAFMTLIRQSLRLN